MPVAATEAKTILIADDLPFVRDRFKSCVERGGHTAVVVRSSTELLGRLRTNAASVNLLVLDLRLARDAGVQLVREIRRLDHGRIPILVFSGTVSSSAEVKELAQLGVVGYLNEYSAPQHIMPAVAPHLYPDRFQKRGSPRVFLAIPVNYLSGSVSVGAVTANLSQGGMAVRTPRPLELGARVSARFRLPGAKADIHADAHVVWSDQRGNGMGLQFSRLESADREKLNEFVDAHFFTNRKALPQ